MIKYISKTNLNESPWISFGAPNKEEYEKWSPRVCGICCLKMIGDAYGVTNNESLYSLAIQCLNLKGYKITLDSIEGVFHKPLLELARKYGLDGKVEKHLTTQKTINALETGKYIILSINKAKINSSLSGGHLVLVHSYKPEAKVFLVNDPEPIIQPNGANVKISEFDLQRISNKKGLIIYKK